MTRYVLLVSFAVLLAAGQMLFKIAADAGSGRPIPQAFLNVWMLAAVALYASATLLWVFILRSTPLSAAYPFAALGFVLVPLGAAVLFGEVLTLRYAAGIVLVVVGILLTVR